METFTDEVMRSLLKRSLDTAKLESQGWRDVGRGPCSSEGEFIDWLTIKDQAESVTSDVRRIRSQLVPSSVAIYGYVYNVMVGRLVEVPEATKAGQLK
jgi:carbonic anhydrase